MTFRSIPQIPLDVDPSIRNILVALKEDMEIITGQRGNNAAVFDIPKTTIAASDVTGALGYTPVNKAGDTTSGAIAVTSNGVPFTVDTLDSNGVQQAFKQAGTTRGYIGASSTRAFTVFDSTGSNERFAVDPSGRILTPNNPLFLAYASANFQPASGAYYAVPINTYVYNRGGHFSTSTYRFTAPVAGVYHFSYGGLVTNIASYPGYYGTLAMRVNGSSILLPYSYGIGTATTANYQWVSASAPVQLGVNDYIELSMYVSAYGIYTYGSGYTYISCHLVG